MEVLMSVLIISLITGLVGPVMSILTSAIDAQINRTDLAESSDLAVQKMDREISLLRDDQSVVTASATQFEFVDRSARQIRYRLVGTTLMRSENGSEYGLADLMQASGLAFTYLDESGSAIASPTVGLGVKTNIRSVNVTFVFQNGTQILNSETRIILKNIAQDSDLFF